MAKNLIPEICKMLGVEIGEKFKIKGDGHTYSIKLDGLHSNQYAMEDDYATLLDLLCGDAEVVKLPWKPKEGTEVYTFSFTTHEYNSRFCPHKGVWYVTQWNWAGFPWQIAALDKGWVFRSKQEAEAALPAVAAEIGVEYEI